MVNNFTRDEKDYLEEAKRAHQDSTPSGQLKQLAKAGNVKEAAIVFSREGMELFADMFGNTMERVVEKAIDNRVSQIIEMKMIEMMEGMKIGMQQGMVSLADNLFKGFDLPNTQEPKQVDEPVQFDLDSVTPTDESLRKMTVEPDPQLEEDTDITEKLNKVFAIHREAKKELPPIEDSVEEIENIEPERPPVQKIAPTPIRMSKTRMIGSKIVELKEFAPIFADVVKQGFGNPVTLKDIVTTVEQSQNVKFLAPSHISNYMVESIDSITKPDKGLFVYTGEWENV